MTHCLKIILFFRYINSRVWSQAGHFNKALSKGPKTTTWIWNLHSHPHDFDMGQRRFIWGTSSFVPPLIRRKVFSSNLGHLSLVFFWISGMGFHGAYFSNYDIWLKDPKHYLPSAHPLSSLIGQDILNSDIGSYFEGIHIRDGIFQLWRGTGIIRQIHLKYGSGVTLIGTMITLSGSYFHMHPSPPASSYKKWSTSLGIHHLSLLFGFSSISWSGHEIHIGVPTTTFLDGGIDPLLIPCPQDLFFCDLIQIVHCGFSIAGLVNFLIYLPKGVDIWSSILNSSGGAVFLGQITAHHFYLGILFITSSLIVPRANGNIPNASKQIPPDIGVLGARDSLMWHPDLWMNLAIGGSLSIAFGDHIYAIPIYPYCPMDYPLVLCLFYHHMSLGGFLPIGAAAHASIFIIGDYSRCGSSQNQMRAGTWEQMAKNPICFILLSLFNGRDVIIPHLIWLSIALGLHSFSLYIHNDTLGAFGRPEDIFHDNSIGLKPVFADPLQSFLGFHINLLEPKLIHSNSTLGTADFMVHHIHAFTIHLGVLILSKGMIYARNSRLVSPKCQLGFRYPCDGPGRGGTCQISPWDHIYLGGFWMYNCISVVRFHYFWKMQSDLWGIYLISNQKIMHWSAGDFTLNSSTINGWLRNFLWSEAAQVIESYGTYQSPYGLIFIRAHFIWAFSLMFLYSGRGYWQELIESILWAHHKLKIMPHIQPRALSISQGRAVGFIHYTLGGVACTWAFFISRMVVVSI